MKGRSCSSRVCRLLDRQGIDDAIRAFAAVSAGFPDCRCLVVGDGPYRARLEAIAAAARTTEHVAFTGQVAEEDLAGHSLLRDVFVMPNRELGNGDIEGLGLMFLEANTCGVPAAAGCAGRSVDAVRDVVSGLMVDGRDVGTITGAITGAIRRMRADAGLRLGFIKPLALARPRVPPELPPELDDPMPAARFGPRPIAGRAGPASRVGDEGFSLLSGTGDRWGIASIGRRVGLPAPAWLG